MSIIEVALRRARLKEAEVAAPAVPAAAAALAVDGGGGGEAARPLQARGDRVLDLNRLESPGFATPEEQRRRQMREFRTIKRALLDAAADEALPLRNLIMVTSAMAGDGKTFTSFHLARSMALEFDRQVLLIDADVLSRGLSGALGLQDAAGLVDLLRDEHLAIEDVLIQTSDDNLCVLPAGKLDDGANELLASERMSRLVARLAGSSSRQITIFDSPPLLLTSEAGALAASVGQIVLVVRAFVTGQDHVREALSRLDPGKRISAVLNAWQPSGPFDKHYDVYYGAGYAADEATVRAAAGRR